MTRGFGGEERIRPGLDRIRTALALSGNPEREFLVVHIAGTNGKGSTACFVEAILSRLLDGPVGLYTSPHLVSPEERIRVGGAKIPPADLSRLLRRAAVLSGRVRAAVGDDLSYFEALTLAACLWFRESRVRVAVAETGLGGRWDATSAMRPLVSVITNVGIDHAEWLGKTLEAIAGEKAGILKEGVPAVFGPLRPAAARVAENAAARLGIPLWKIGRDFRWTSASSGRIDLHLPGVEIRGARVGPDGSFQRDNAAVACAAAWRASGTLRLPGESFRTAVRLGLAAARWPGRLSRLPGRGNGRTLLDGAHNPDAARILAGEIARLKGEGRKPVVALWSMLGDKDIGGFLRETAKVVDGWVYYGMDHPRAAPLALLGRRLARRGLDGTAAGSFREAWRTARRRAGRKGIVLVCGSLAAVGDAWKTRVGEVP